VEGLSLKERILQNFMVNFKVNDTPCEIEIVNDNPRYILDIKKKKLDNFNWRQAVFFFGNNPKGKNVCITGRDFCEYDLDVQNIEINPSRKYCEVGAGLGGILPFLFDAGVPRDNLFVIDPANYDLMRLLIEEGLKQTGKMEFHYNFLEKLKRRCEFYLTNVNLINQTLSDALCRYDLKNRFDFVISHRANRFYPQLDFGRNYSCAIGKSEESDKLLEKLINKHGIILGR
jgi:hypothetical protein